MKKLFVHFVLKCRLIYMLVKAGINVYEDIYRIWRERCTNAQRLKIADRITAELDPLFKTISIMGDKVTLLYWKELHFPDSMSLWHCTFCRTGEKNSMDLTT